MEIQRWQLIFHILRLYQPIISVLCLLVSDSMIIINNNMIQSKTRKIASESTALLQTFTVVVHQMKIYSSSKTTIPEMKRIT